MEALKQKLNSPLSARGRIALVIVAITLLYPAWQVGGHIALTLDSAATAASAARK